ncbi:multicopper oxidase domain-containing protein [Streptomyces sp. LX-29]|uniref:multicopper oxidase domain-containing protein n=1 Tax=Streptomyces sp. LX-29 TaxID=2900152 RepID=UPI00240E8525|nr:multicopper oxidase domain-containing protein [Streptomyces sp. LX-29]WFB10351.1 multicopper oxidase domain-containing protein [Streptomyces sp. LX-29]
MSEAEVGGAPRRTFSRRLFTGGAAAAAVSPFGLAPASARSNPREPEAPGPGGAPLEPEAPQSPDSPAARRLRRVTRAGGEVHRMRLYAERLPNGQMGYGRERGKATIPGPVIEMVEGDTLHIEFENTMDTTCSLHPHGLDYDIDSDGTFHQGGAVRPGERRVYTWRSHAPTQRPDGTWRGGSAGYWHYHDHMVGTPHGTGGLRRGLYGPVVVRRKGDILPDRQFTIVFNDTKINNLREGPNLRATMGDRVEIIMITHGKLFHTFHLHGHRWADNRTGMLAGLGDPSRIIDNKVTGPADSFGFQVIAGEDVGPGAWMYHCHVQPHSDHGMAGLFLVSDQEGVVPTREHLR